MADPSYNPYVPASRRPASNWEPGQPGQADPGPSEPEPAADQVRKRALGAGDMLEARTALGAWGRGSYEHLRSRGCLVHGVAPHLRYEHLRGRGRARALFCAPQRPRHRGRAT